MNTIYILVLIMTSTAGEHSLKPAGTITESVSIIQKSWNTPKVLFWDKAECEAVAKKIDARMYELTPNSKPVLSTGPRPLSAMGD